MFLAQLNNAICLSSSFLPRILGGQFSWCCKPAIFVDCLRCFVPSKNNYHQAAIDYLNKPLSGWGLALLCIGIAVFLSICGGQDANWDLRNYHYYNPYAWVNDRADIDIAPAQLQSFHSPYADLPYYYMAKAGLSSWLVSAILAIPAATALFFLALISKRILPCARQNIYLIAVILIAATGASGGPLIGTTMSEWHLVALFMFAVWLILKPFEFGNELGLTEFKLWRVLLAGILGGIAVGLKLTAGTYALGLAVLILALPAQFRIRLKRLAVLGIGGVIGTVISYGPWGYELWCRFGNPFFPYFNNVFISPWAEPSPFSDPRYAADSLWKILATPWRIMKVTSGLVLEMPFRDWRLGLGLPAMLWLAWTTPMLNTRRIWQALLMMFLTIYFSWLALFGYYRYANFMELIAALAICAIFANSLKLIDSDRLRILAIIALLVATAGVTNWPAWGRIAHGDMAVSAKIPSLPQDSMVMMATLEPLGFIVPSLPPKVPVISVINNFMNPAWGGHAKLHVLAAQRIAQHKGPLFALVNASQTEEKYYMGIPIAEMLLALGLEVDFKECKSIITPMMVDNVALCGVRRVPVTPIKWQP